MSGQAPEDRKAVDELIKALKAADPDVRRQAVEALAQLSPDKAKPAVLTLEQMLAQAGQDNPDIRVAQAKLREADADLNRTRLLVAQKVVKLYQDVKVQRAALTETEQRLRRVEQLYQQKAVALSEVDIAKQALIQARAKLESAEAELPYLLGAPERKGVGFHPDGKMMASGQATTVTIWKDEIAREAATHRVPVQLYLRFAPDGKSLMSRDDKGVLRIWDVATGKEAKVNEDAEFVRRVSLDLTGVVPAPQTVQKFLQSKDPNKAGKFIDELLASPECAQYVHRAWVDKLLAPPPDTIPQRIRKALDTPVTANFENMPLASILDDIGTTHGIPFIWADRRKLQTATLTLKDKVPLGAVLQALQDCSTGDEVRFVVRDYGVLVAPKNRVPDDATPLNEFWRRAAEPSRPAGRR
ncbi:hypothetical protein AYO44_06365 [Planctomycetaceae bacterium SCGC AG-212-F19]|nr:hypothetical protein AYO44_06365 [Planctomycetaceae bacterium SCGC AG-212-F19]